MRNARPKIPMPGRVRTDGQQTAQPQMPYVPLVKPSLFKRVRDVVLDTVNIYRQMSLDRKNHKVFRDVVQEQARDPRSEFIKNNLKVADDGESVVFVTSIPAEFQNSGHDFMIYDKLNEQTYFITEYLRTGIAGGGFHQYITIPEYYHIEDPTSDSVSYTYIAVWKYRPIIEGALYLRAVWIPVGVLLAGVAAAVGIIWL